MGINNLFRPFVAEAAVAGYRIVKAGAAGGVVQSTGPTDKHLGTSGGDDHGYITYATGEMVDVAVDPVPKVRLGGTVAAGDLLTSDANGKAVATTTAGHSYIGRAEVAGVLDDVITYLRAPGLI